MSPGPFQGVNASIIKVETRNYSPPPPPRPGGFHRVLSAFGAIAAPVGFATSIFLPPMAVLGGVGLTSQYAGAHFQQKAAMNQAGGGGSGYIPVSYPGLSPSVPGLPSGGQGPAIGPAAFAPGGIGVDPDVMNIISPRNEMTVEMMQSPGGL